MRTGPTEPAIDIPSSLHDQCKITLCHTILIAPTFSFPSRLVADGEVKVTFTLEALESDHLENGVTGSQAKLLPTVEVVGHVDGASGAVLATDGPVLLEAGGAVDLRNVVVVQAVDVVDTAVAVDLTEDVSIARSTRTVRVNNVPLGHGVTGPSVDGKSPVTRSLEVTVPGDGAMKSQLEWVQVKREQ